MDQIMIALFLSVLLSHNNPELIMVDRVDCIEVNHVYRDENGVPVLDQLIFWDCNTYGELVCVDYRMLKRSKNRVEADKQEVVKIREKLKKIGVDFPVQQEYTVYVGPHIQKTERGYEYLFFDDGILRKVIGKSFMETHTYQDREVENRQMIKSSWRRKLSNPKYRALE